MNKITLIGNLTHCPEVRYTLSAISVCSFTMAVNRRHEEKSGEQSTDFLQITTWRHLADSCSRYHAKSRKISVLGELQPQLHSGKDGPIHMFLEVLANEVAFLSSRQENETSMESGGGVHYMAVFSVISSVVIPF